LPVSEYFLAFVSFSPRITDLPICLCDAQENLQELQMVFHCFFGGALKQA
jgi:hypothetical protein